MEVKIERSQEYGPVSEGEIGIVEAFLGSNFPKDYRCFMLEHNGGTPFPDMFKIPSEGDSSLVDSFFRYTRKEVLTISFGALKNIAIEFLMS